MRLSLLLLVGLVACHSSPPPPPTSGSEVAAPSGATTLSAAPLDLPASGADRDPAFMQSLRTMLDACSADFTVKHGFDDCRKGEAYPWKAFREQKLSKLEATCLSLLEDTDPKLRWVASRCFHGWPSWASVSELDEKGGERFLAALQREPRDSPIDMGLASLALHLPTDAQRDKLRAYALAPTTPADVKILLAVYQKDEKYFELVKSLRTSDDKRLLAAAEDGYALQFDKHRDEACSLWKEHLDDADPTVRKRAIGHLTGGASGGCAEDAHGYDNYCFNGGGPGLNMSAQPDQKDPAWCPEPAVSHALTAIEKRVADNEVDEYVYGEGLASIAMHPKSTSAQKRRAIAALRKLVDTKGAKTRRSSVKELAKSDPGGLAYLQKYADDPALKSEIESARKNAKSAKK